MKTAKVVLADCRIVYRPDGNWTKKYTYKYVYPKHDW